MKLENIIKQELTNLKNKGPINESIKDCCLNKWHNWRECCGLVGIDPDTVKNPAKAGAPAICDVPCGDGSFTGGIGCAPCGKGKSANLVNTIKESIKKLKSLKESDCGCNKPLQEKELVQTTKDLYGGCVCVYLDTDTGDYSHNTVYTDCSCTMNGTCCTGAGLVHVGPLTGKAPMDKMKAAKLAPKSDDKEIKPGLKENNQLIKTIRESIIKAQINKLT